MRLRHLLSESLTGRALHGMATTSAPSRTVLTRRSFLASTVATSSVILTPGQAFASNSRPEFLAGETLFKVSWGGYDWTVDCRRFDGHPVLKLVAHEGGYRGELSDGSLASLGLSANLQFEISPSPSGDWVFSICIPALSIEGSTTLGEWLTGQQVAAASTRCQEFRSGYGALKLALHGIVKSIDSSWRLSFDRDASIAVGTRSFVANDLSISLCPRDGNTEVRSQIDAPYAKLMGPNEWLKARSSIVATSNAGTAMRVRYRANADKSWSLVVEPESGAERIAVGIRTANRGKAHITLENYRFVEFLDGRALTRALIGDIAESGSRLEENGINFALSGIGSAGRFRAETRKGKLTRLDCAPSAVAATIPIEGALTSDFPLSKPHAIRFFGPKGSFRDDLVEPFQVAQAHVNTSDVPDFLAPGQGLSIPTGHITCSGCAVDGKPEDLRYFSTHAVRPDDLLWLGFEFYNFELKTDKSGKKYLAPLNVPGPSLVIVHFPPQHILEDAYNEDLGCGPKPPTLAFPLGAKLSGASRLVFEFPRDEGRLELTLDALTDWRRWTVKKVPDRRHPQLIRAPIWDETAIEVPSRIVSQPADKTHWIAKKYEGTAANRYALFSVELMPDVAFDPAEPSGIRRARFVPIWTPDFAETGVQPPTTPDGLFLRLRSKLVGLDPFGPRTRSGAACAPSSTPDDLQPGQSIPISDGERREIVRTQS